MKRFPIQTRPTLLVWLLLITVSELCAQTPGDSSALLSGAWLTFGPTRSIEQWRGGYLSLNLDFAGRYVVTGRLAGFEETAGSKEPRREVFDVALLIGIRVQPIRPFPLQLTFSMGPSLVALTRRGEYLGEGTGTDGNPVSRYEKVDESDEGLALDVRADVVGLQAIAIGVDVFADINETRPFVGGALCCSMGYIH